MLKVKIFRVLILLSVLLASAASATEIPRATTSVDLAILLDTSNSMDGLISQAKSQLWTIVQQFADVEKDGESPYLRVALFEYGNTNLPANEGFIRQVVQLTDDLDVISEALFALTTDGGDEYCGEVIDEAITRLDWSDNRNAYRTIFIAGNEPFTQGSVDYEKACKRAAKHRIVVNTFHCGDQREGVQGHWRDGAQLGKGEFFNIDQDRTVVYIPCPQDPIIIRLNSELNETYLWYGSADKRDLYCNNQATQDSNAKSLSSSVAVSRSVTKSGKAYDNRSRDLVDAFGSDADILENVKEEELPDEMQKMTPEERAAHLKEMNAKRADLKQKIGKQAAEREIYLTAERAKMAAETGEATLGDAVVIAIRKQLKEAGFELVGPKK